MKQNKYARFYALIKSINTFMPLTKEEAVSDFTQGRTTHLSELSIQELSAFETALSSMVPKTQLQYAPANKNADKLRKAIISQFLSIGRTAADAKIWAEKYGVNGTKAVFNHYDNQQLYILLKNAKKMVLDFNKAQRKAAL